MTENELKQWLIAMLLIIVGIIVYSLWPESKPLHPDCYGNDWPALLTEFHINCVNKAKELGLI